MTAFLNCIDHEQTLMSLVNILNNDLLIFLDENHHKFHVDQHGFSQYEGLSIEEVKDFFNTDTFDFEEIAVNHVTSIIDMDSYRDKGIFNLADLSTSQNGFKSFLNTYGITFTITDGGRPYFEYEGKEISSNYIETRLTKDRCINGFLLGDSCDEDTNVRDIRECPEIISHLGRLTNLPEIEQDWINAASPSYISFRVHINEVHDSTFDEELTFEEKKEYFLLRALDYLLIKDYSFYYPQSHPMIHLKEETNVPSENILTIKELS